MSKSETQHPAVRMIDRIREVNDSARLTYDVEAFELAKEETGLHRARRHGRSVFRGTRCALALTLDGVVTWVVVDLLEKRAVVTVEACPELHTETLS